MTGVQTCALPISVQSLGTTDAAGSAIIDNIQTGYAAADTSTVTLRWAAGDVATWYVKAYEYLNASYSVTLRGLNGTLLSMTLLADSAATLSRASASALATIANLSDLYDAAKYWGVQSANINYPSATANVIAAGGTTIDVGSRNILVDATAASAFAVNTGTHTATIKSTTLAAGSKFRTLKTSGTITLANAAALSCGVELNGGVLVAQDIDAVTSAITTTGTCRIDVSAPGVYPAAAINAASKIRVTAATSGDIHDCRACVFTSGAVFENNSGQPITVKLLPAQTTPTKLETSGTITFDKATSATFTVTNMVSGSRLLIRRTDTQAVLYNDIPGTSYAYGYSVAGSIPIEAIVRKATSAPYYQEWRTTATLSGTDASVPANQASDEG